MPTSVPIVPTCRQLDVAVTGSWRDDAPQPTWSGSLSSSEAFVALVFGFGTDHTYWWKSEPAVTGTLPLELMVLFNRFDEDTACQLIFSAGCAGIYELTTQLPRTERHDFDLLGRIHCGWLYRFFSRTCGAPGLLGLLVLAKSDVTVRRNRVWGVKPTLLTDTSGGAAPVLALGRRGRADRNWPPDPSLERTSPGHSTGFDR